MRSKNFDIEHPIHFTYENDEITIFSTETNKAIARLTVQTGVKCEPDQGRWVERPTRSFFVWFKSLSGHVEKNVAFAEVYDEEIP